nr:MAG TPA: hypothetical protein [Caudoviricetes sp.]
MIALISKLLFLTSFILSSNKFSTIRTSIKFILNFIK